MNSDKHTLVLYSQANESSIINRGYKLNNDINTCKRVDASWLLVDTEVGEYIRHAHCTLNFPNGIHVARFASAVPEVKKPETFLRLSKLDGTLVCNGHLNAEQIADIIAIMERET